MVGGNVKSTSRHQKGRTGQTEQSVFQVKTRMATIFQKILTVINLNCSCPQMNII